MRLKTYCLPEIVVYNENAAEEVFCYQVGDCIFYQEE
jgi:hypothetical protein